MEDLVRRTLEEWGLRRAGPLEEIRAIWPRVIGERLAGKVKPVTLRGECLTLRAVSPVLRTEIQAFHRERILEELARELPETVVTRLRVVS